MKKKLAAAGMSLLVVLVGASVLTMMATSGMAEWEDKGYEKDGLWYPNAVWKGDASEIFGTWPLSYEADQLYCPSNPFYDNDEDVRYLALFPELISDGSKGFVYASNPPMYPGKRVYRIVPFHSLDEIDKLNKGVGCIIEIKRIIRLEPKYKNVKQEIEHRIFEGYKLRGLDK